MKFLKKAEESIVVVCIILFSVYCGGGNEIASNEYFGILPGLAMNYQSDLDALQTEMDECTDRDKCSEIREEIEMLELVADEAIYEYAIGNQSADLPFEQNDNGLFVVEEIWIKSAGIAGITFEARVTITEYGESMWGAHQRNFFVYSKVLDEEGIPFSDCLMMYTADDRDPMVAGREVEVSGFIRNLASLIKFDTFAFTTMQEYDDSMNQW